MSKCPRCRFAYEPGDIFCMNCELDFCNPPPEFAAALAAFSPEHVVADVPAPSGIVEEEVRPPPPAVPAPSPEQSDAASMILPAVPQKMSVDKCPNCGGDAQNFGEDGTCWSCGAPAVHCLRDDFYILVSDKVAARSHLGVKHHRNEDYVDLGTVEIGERTINWFVVCDGVSRSTNPQRASEQAAHAAGSVLRAAALEGEAPSEALLRDAINAAQKAVFAVLPEPTAPASWGPPATTFVAAYIKDGKAWIAWCGDARAYLITRVDAGFRASLLTRDHTVLNELVDQGRSLEQAYLECPVDERHALVQCLGDYGENMEDFHPSFAEVSLQDAVAFIGCSDGVWNDMHPMESNDASAFAAMYAASQTDALTFAKAAVDQASGADNKTCAVVYL